MLAGRLWWCEFVLTPDCGSPTVLLWRPAARSCPPTLPPQSPSGWEFVGGEMEVLPPDRAHELFATGRALVEPVFSACGELKPRDMAKHVGTALAILEVGTAPPMWGPCGTLHFTGGGAFGPALQCSAGRRKARAAASSLVWRWSKQLFSACAGAPGALAGPAAGGHG